LGTLDGTFAAVVLTAGAVVVLATAFLRRWLKELNKKVSHHDGKVSAFLQEMMEKLLMVQSMDVSAEVERRADLLLEERYALQRKRKNVSLLTNTGISVMFHGAGFVALIWCAWRMLMGQMSFGSLTAVIQLVNQLQTPFVSLSGVLPQYVATLASAERLMELDRICVHTEAEAKDAEKIYRETESIRAENLTFSYGRERILQDASMEIPKGAFCVITGHSGIGKSTLLKLLLGVFQPESGKLFVQTSAEEIPLPMLFLKRRSNQGNRSFLICNFFKKQVDL
jgi:ATP-binding cassette subfamily B protein